MGEYLDRYPLAGTSPDRYTPWVGTPPGWVPPLQVHPTLVRYTPWQVHPPDRCSPTGTPPWHMPPAGTPQQSMLGYGQQVGGTRPTGMHSCFHYFCVIAIAVIHDGNNNGKNGYHGDQLKCSHCDGKRHTEMFEKTCRCHRSVNEP